VGEGRERNKIGRGREGREEGRVVRNGNPLFRRKLRPWKHFYHIHGDNM